jgi:hypothetical protein
MIDQRSIWLLVPQALAALGLSSGDYYSASHFVRADEATVQFSFFSESGGLIASATINAETGEVVE